MDKIGYKMLQKVILYCFFLSKIRIKKRTISVLYCFFHHINHLFCIVFELDRGKHSLLTNRYDKFYRKKSINLPFPIWIVIIAGVWCCELTFTFDLIKEGGQAFFPGTHFCNGISAVSYNFLS